MSNQQHTYCWADGERENCLSELCVLHKASGASVLVWKNCTLSLHGQREELWEYNFTSFRHDVQASTEWWKIGSIVPKSALSNGGKCGGKFESVAAGMRWMLCGMIYAFFFNKDSWFSWNICLTNLKHYWSHFSKEWFLILRCIICTKSSQLGRDEKSDQTVAKQKWLNKRCPSMRHKTTHDTTCRGIAWFGIISFKNNEGATWRSG